ncbi:MAG: hypothetical protein MUC79_12575 [Thiobacillaceae bacterium]|nr:hypothetical protein [Thiobacillaceae bacterium]
MADDPHFGQSHAGPFPAYTIHPDSAARFAEGDRLRLTLSTRSLSWQFLSQ